MAAQPPPAPSPRRYGAQCLDGLAEYLRGAILEHDEVDGAAGRTLDAASRLNTSYVLVHLYLIPGDVMQRGQLRDSIHQGLVALGAVQVHDLAYAVPANQGEALTKADETWRALRTAGMVNDQHVWQTGDVIYLHYWTPDGPAVWAAAPRAGRLLPFAEHL